MIRVKNEDGDFGRLLNVLLVIILLCKSIITVPFKIQIFIQFCLELGFSPVSATASL